MVVESRSVKRNAKNAWGLGRDRPIFPAATAPFPKSCASYFRFARFNTLPLYYLRAWHRLESGLQMQCSNLTESVSLSPNLSPSPQHLSPRPFSFSNDQLAQASQNGLIVILSSFYVVRHFRLSILLRHSPFI